MREKGLGSFKIGPFPIPTSPSESIAQPKMFTPLSVCLDPRRLQPKIKIVIVAGTATNGKNAT